MTKESKRKIIYVITKSNWGGAQRYVYDLATHLPKDAFDVVVAAPEGALTKMLDAAGIRTTHLTFTQRHSFLFTLLTLGSLFSLIALLRRERPDVLHLNSAKAGGLGALAGRIAGTSKIVFTAHGWSFLEDRNIVVKELMYFFSWLTAVLSHAVITVSEHDLTIAKRMPFVGNKVVRIYNGIDPLTLASGESVRRHFPAGAQITGTIGELTANKNHIALIEEARSKPQMYVALVGEGKDRTYLESKIRDYGLTERVKILGFIPAAEALKGFDVFALPSLKEGLPYVLLEAKAAGLPIVANRVGGVGEILDAQDMREFSLDTMIKKTTALYSLTS
jgi:glycosyltransferase involved in cell wall biosynthesis